MLKWLLALGVTLAAVVWHLHNTERIDLDSVTNMIEGEKHRSLTADSGDIDSLTAMLDDMSGKVLTVEKIDEDEKTEKPIEISDDVTTDNTYYQYRDANGQLHITNQRERVGNNNQGKVQQINMPVSDHRPASSSTLERILEANEISSRMHRRAARERENEEHKRNKEEYYRSKQEAAKKVKEQPKKKKRSCIKTRRRKTWQRFERDMRRRSGRPLNRDELIQERNK